MGARGGRDARSCSGRSARGLGAGAGLAWRAAAATKLRWPLRAAPPPAGSRSRSGSSPTAAVRSSSMSPLFSRDSPAFYQVTRAPAPPRPAPPEARPAVGTFPAGPAPQRRARGRPPTGPPPARKRPLRPGAPECYPRRLFTCHRSAVPQFSELWADVRSLTWLSHSPGVQDTPNRAQLFGMD